MYDKRGLFGTVKPELRLYPTRRAKEHRDRTVVVNRYAGGGSPILKEMDNFVSPEFYPPAVARMVNDIPPQNAMTKRLQATTRKNKLRNCQATPPGDENPGGGKECRVNLKDLDACMVTDRFSGLEMRGDCDDLFLAITVLERHDANPIQNAIGESVAKKAKKAA